MAILLACLTFFSTGLGGLAAIRFHHRLHLVLGFSAGAVLGIVLFEILPEVLADRGPSSPIMLSTAGGFMTFFALERYSSLHRSREHSHTVENHEAELGVLSAAALCFHSLLDGVGIGVGFQHSIRIGLLIGLAVITHDFGDGLNTVSVLLAHGHPVRRSVPWLFLDMTAPLLGATSTLLFQFPEDVLPWFLGFFSGSFLYIGASDLLPEARANASPLVGLATLCGMLLIFLISRFLLV